MPSFSPGRARAAAVLAASLAAAGPAAAAQTTPPAARPQASERGRDESPASRAAARIAALQAEAAALAAQEKTLLVELRALEVERELRTEQLAAAERDLAAMLRRLRETESRAASLRATAAGERPGVEARMVHLYKLGRAGYWKLLLDVDDLRAIGRAYRTAAALNQLDRERVRQHQRTLEALARELTTLQAQVAETTRLRGQAAVARSAAERAVASRARLVAAIAARQDLNAQLTAELDAARRRLQGTVAQLGRSAAALPLRPFRGALPWPAAGVVTARFGRPRPGAPGPGRTGIDLSLAEGQPVRAVHEGVVAYAERFTGYGNLVILDHGDGAYSLYGYLASIDVGKGERVEAQARLGASGRNSAGNPAMYFELRVDGAPVDPLQWLKR